MPVHHRMLEPVGKAMKKAYHGAAFNQQKQFHIQSKVLFWGSANATDTKSNNNNIVHTEQRILGNLNRESMLLSYFEYSIDAQE